MNEFVPSADNATPDGGEQRRPDAEVLAAGEAAAANLHDLEASHSLAEDPERRAADVKIWVENECDYFGIQPKDDPVADQLTELFCDHETRQHERGRAEYDVTVEDRRRLDRIIERGMQAAAETEETAALAQEASAEAAETDEHVEFNEAVEEDETAYASFAGVGRLSQRLQRRENCTYGGPP